MIVVDTNVIGYLYLSSTHSVQAEQALLKDPEWAAPLLWRSEFRNILALYLRKNIIVPADALSMMAEAETLMEGREFAPPSTQVLNLVMLSSCSAYDCEFVALAQDLGAPLVTADRKVVGEFPDIAVALERFVE